MVEISPVPLLKILIHILGRQIEIRMKYPERSLNGSFLRRCRLGVPDNQQSAFSSHQLIKKNQQQAPAVNHPGRHQNMLLLLPQQRLKGRKAVKSFHMKVLNISIGMAVSNNGSSAFF